MSGVFYFQMVAGKTYGPIGNDIEVPDGPIAAIEAHDPQQAMVRFVRTRLSVSDIDHGVTVRRLTLQEQSRCDVSYVDGKLTLKDERGIVRTVL